MDLKQLKVQGPNLNLKQMSSLFLLNQGLDQMYKKNITGICNKRANKLDRLQYCDNVCNNQQALDMAFCGINRIVMMSGSFFGDA